MKALKKAFLFQYKLQECFVNEQWYLCRDAKSVDLVGG